MSQAMTRGQLTPSAPRQVGKYDQWLDGGVWVLTLADVPWIRGKRARYRFRKALADRARIRGIAHRAEWLEDGSLAVCAGGTRATAATTAEPDQLAFDDGKAVTDEAGGIVR